MKDYKNLSETEKSVINGLNDTISKLRKQIGELWFYKERFLDLTRRCKELEHQLNIKRSVYKIIERKDNIDYIKQIIKIDDTPEGLLIKIS